jgi:hypothetical protein
MKINKDWKTVFKRYSFITHLLIAISSVGLLGMAPYIDYIPMWAGLSLMATFALMGVVGSFIKQEVREDDCKLD